MSGASIITLAKNLYSSEARFILELIQNAEDCSYEKAKERHEEPFICFQVYPRRIVIESNEDEFKDENVRILCNLGKSSKAGVPGYIGEKGIGFKSVFMVASKAHIQSGPFSFSFKHSRGDLGIGMVNPIWEERPDMDIDDPLTRITLFLHNDTEALKGSKNEETINQSFERLEKTLLLFLKKLKRIVVLTYDDDDKMISSAVYTSRYDKDSHIATVTETLSKNGKKTENPEDRYHITKKIINNLPKHDNRTYTEINGEIRGDDTAEVVLAFQIDGESNPVIRNQNVYAFLPVGPVGFNFLIQSDFVTKADREGIVTDSARNRELRRGIAATFVEAVKQFCSHETLQYAWVQYLPKSSIAGSFWPELVAEIKSCLVGAKVMRTLESKLLQPIETVRRINENFLDKYNDPLFEDLHREVYIAKDHPSDSLNVLSNFSLTYMDSETALKRISADIESPTSRMKDPNTDGDWHSRAARFLCLQVDESQIQALSLIPLEGGGWVSAKEVEGKVYYYQVNGAPIPNDLGLHLLRSGPAKNPDRKKLFQRLGVTNASSSKVRNLILQKYEHNRKLISYKPNLTNSMAHLKYLYSTYDKGTGRIPGLCVLDHRNEVHIPTAVYVYLSSNEQYSASELLKPIPYENGKVEAPSFKVSFLHPAYLEFPPLETSRPISWELWLQNYINIKKVIPLTNSQEQLSRAFSYVMSRRPEMVLGALRYGWSQYSEILHPTRKNLLSEAKVLCENSKMVPLGDAFLPTPFLKTNSAKFLVGHEAFPFLQLPQPLTGESPQEWAFLADFGVGMSESLMFYLRALDCIIDVNGHASSVSDPSRIFRLYEAVQSQCWGSEEKEGQIKLVRDFFEKKQAIYVPSRGNFQATWAYPKDCLWEAPTEFESKYPMESSCKDKIVRSDTNAAILKQFFHGTLEIQDITWEDLLSELETIKSCGETDVSRVRDLYRQLNVMRKNISSSEANQIRDKFTNLAYIYVDRENSWHTIGDCLWSSAAEITGKFTISGQYETLKDFFVKFLKVTAPNISMLENELVGLGRVKASKARVMAVIQYPSKSEDIPQPSEDLRDAKVLPVSVRGGSEELRSSRSNFSVPDRQKLAEEFKETAVILDFDLTDVRNLQPFLKWLGLEKRYLSRTVTEVSQFNGVPGADISNRDRGLSCKAHALFRCAVYFHSPRVQGEDFSLYQLLRHAKVYQTDIISRRLDLLENDGSITESKPSQSRLHIDEKGTELRVYVPKDPKEQELCYLWTLPQRILDLIMTDPNTLRLKTAESRAITIIGNVLKSSTFVVDDLLEEAGIIPHKIPAEDIPAEDIPAHREDTGDDIDRQRSSSSNTSSRASSTGWDISEPRTPMSSSSVSESSTRASPLPFRTNIVPTSYASSANTTPTNSAVRPALVGVQCPLANTFESSCQYERLLDKIITASRSAVFPTFNMGPPPLSSTTAHESPGYTEFPAAFGVRSENQMEHDKKIGAAGELFVFEVLSRLFPTLSGYTPEAAFSKANWESTIRNYVKVHNKYADLDAWPGRETADITYKDDKGIFTRFLREKGYLQSEIWENATPMYYLEVKTTTKDCDSRLFVSKAQYKRMKDIHNASISDTTMVYVIMRVFNLDNDNIDMRIYVDPIAMEGRRELKFTAEQWTVVPGEGEGDSSAIVSN